MLSVTPSATSDRGWLRIRPVDPGAPPRIHRGLLEHRDDVTRMVEAAPLARRLARSAPLRDCWLVTSSRQAKRCGTTTLRASSMSSGAGSRRTTTRSHERGRDVTGGGGLCLKLRDRHQNRVSDHQPVGTSRALGQLPALLRARGRRGRVNSVPLRTQSSSSTGLFDRPKRGRPPK
jgi:hypothetical protein